MVERAKSSPRSRRTPSLRPSYLPSTAVAFDGLGLIFANSLHRYHSRIGDYREGRDEGRRMPRRKSLVTVIRDMVREQVEEAVQRLLGAVGGPKKKAKNGRRRPPRPSA